MTAATLPAPLTAGRLSRAFYRTALGFTALSGFAQMPIFKRYYIADLPGLAWLDAFYTTHFIHYLGAAVLLGFMALGLSEYALLLRRERRVSPYGWMQGALLAGIAATGILRVIKNYEGYYLSSGAVVFLDLAHLALAMAFLLMGLAGLAAGKRWTIPR